MYSKGKKEMITLSVGRIYNTERGLKAVITETEPDSESITIFLGYVTLEDGREVSTQWNVHGYELGPGHEYDLASEWAAHSELRISEQLKEAISKELYDIVHEFNTKFAAWHGKTGCYANFEWLYSGDSPKQMGIKDIDARIFKKLPPKFDDGQVLKR